MGWQLLAMAVLAVSGVVLGAWYMLWLVQRVFFGPLREPAGHAPALEVLCEQGEMRDDLPLELLFRALAAEEIVELRKLLEIEKIRKVKNFYSQLMDMRDIDALFPFCVQRQNSPPPDHNEITTERPNCRLVD